MLRALHSAGEYGEVWHGQDRDTSPPLLAPRHDSGVCVRARVRECYYISIQ